MESSHGRRLDALLGHLSSGGNSLTVDRFSRRSDQLNVPGPVVIGAMVLDIHAHPFLDALRPGTTTPGKVQYVNGGVARNVIECVSRLGLAPFFISAVGQDMAGDKLIAHLQSLGLKTDAILRVANATTPVVNAIFDGKGELAAAVADTRTFENNLSPDWIGRFQHQIQNASLVMLDANLSEAALQAACKLANEAKVPVWFEPVSVTKAVRYNSVSNHLTFASPNVEELEAMGLASGSDFKLKDASISLDSCEDVHSIVSLLRPPIVSLLERGIRFLVITLGGLGVLVCSNFCCAKVDTACLSQLEKSQDATLMSGGVCCMHFPALLTSVTSLSGAGDCFVGGVLTALSAHEGLSASMAFGVAVSRYAIQSDQNVPSNLSAKKLKADAMKVLSSSKHVHAS